MNTTDITLPHLGQYDPGSSPKQSDKVVVFVHGIYSSHVTFAALKNTLIQNNAFCNWNFHWFDYDFNQHIPESGTQLADLLIKVFGNQTTSPEVTLVCHSMGGLVGRLALLQHGNGLPFVKRLIMLGTPNHGTLQTARLAMLAYLLRGGASVLWSVCGRKPGIKELTRVGLTVGKHLSQAEMLNTQHVEYVTIPGMFFNEDTEWFRGGPPGTSRGLRVLNRFTHAFPLAGVGLGLPHDGIVAEGSVSLDSLDASRFSERSTGSQSAGATSNYLHIGHLDYRMVDHVTVHSCSRTLEILQTLLLSKSIAAWRKAHNLPGYRFRP